MNNVFIIKDTETGLFWNKVSNSFPKWGDTPFIYPKKSNAQSAINYHANRSYTGHMDNAVIVEATLTEVISDES